MPTPPTAPGLTPGYLEGPHLLLDANDRPLVASRVFVESSTFATGAVAAFKFDGTQWAVSDAHQANATGSVLLGSKTPVGAVVDGTGQLIIAWTEVRNSNANDVRYYVQSWAGAGAAWQGLGSTLGLVDNPTQNLTAQMCLARDASGNPSMAFAEQGVAGTGGLKVGVSLFVP